MQHQQTTAASSASQAMAHPHLLRALEWRCIGPYRGGRVVAVAGDPIDPAVFYFGACAGGVWKTTVPVELVFGPAFGRTGPAGEDGTGTIRFATAQRRVVAFHQSSRLTDDGGEDLVGGRRAGDQGGHTT
jgi:hypothetical protein